MIYYNNFVIHYIIYAYNILLLFQNYENNRKELQIGTIFISLSLFWSQRKIPKHKTQLLYS